ncbi:MAG: DUF1801 domain-containing protein [Chloroflexota bacterium]
MEPTPAELLLMTLPEVRAATAQALRELIARRFPDAQESLRTGWRVLTYRLPTGRGRATAEFAWVMVEPVHVHLGFSWGVLMADPDGTLEGRELKRVRWITFETPKDIDEARAVALLEEAAGLARMGHRGRLGLLLDG